MQHAMPTDFQQKFLHLCRVLVTGNVDLVYKEFKEWFDATRALLIHGVSLEDVLRQNHNEQIPVLTDVLPNQDEYVQNTFYRRFFDSVRRMSMRVMVSQNGRIGMVLEAAMKGDLICLCFGCSVPMLLRKT